MKNLNENQIRIIKEALSYLPVSYTPTIQDKMDLINLRHFIKEHEIKSKAELD